MIAFAFVMFAALFVLDQLFVRGFYSELSERRCRYCGQRQRGPRCSVWNCRGSSR
jgi:hypothetical protein